MHAHGGTITAASHVTTYRHDPSAQITGGHVIEIPKLDTIETWAAYSGIPLEDGHLVVFKAVDKDLVSGHKMPYPIGGTVEAADWQATSDCGHGLHFSPHPLIAATYLYEDSKRFLACRVEVGQAVVIDGEKIKARSCVVLYEVTPGGERMPDPEPEVEAEVDAQVGEKSKRSLRGTARA